MRLTIHVREGDRHAARSTYGRAFSSALDKMITDGAFGASDGVGRWAGLAQRGRDLAQQRSEGLFEIDVPEADLTVGTLKTLCLAEARRLEAARPEPAPGQLPDSEGVADYPKFNRDAIVGVWLSDPVRNERLNDDHRLSELLLTDGDLLVLSIEHPTHSRFRMAMRPNPAELLRWLQLEENATAPAAGSRLWGVLLYTQADVELATYVRTHFDDLNVLSGPATRVFVVERRQGWAASKRYWHRRMEPELYRVMGVMGWLRWTPYDPQGAYEIASLLGLGPEQLPCLVFFHSRQGPLYDGDKLVFRIEHTSTAYFRALFGGVAAALRTLPDSAQALNGSDSSSSCGRSRTSEDFMFLTSREAREFAPGDQALRNLLSSDRLADAAAFAALDAARHTIRSAMQAAVPPPAGITVSNSHVVLETSGATLSENFYFQGENTTFINRPRDTVIQDFQNTHGTATGADDLTQLLRLVLSSRSMTAADREEAATTIHDLARIGSDPQPDAAATSTRMDRLRALLTSSADIAQPALALLTSLTALFSS
ncbi:hypothetical protein [Streptomyces sasae]|uniref:hypothetical protein n=1 Tax=Streptomyces sasae TaxID=1266772 RepID=UPI00292CB283|nr:hypothetical protein [Streptomyces sasae]